MPAFDSELLVLSAGSGNADLERPCGSRRLRRPLESAATDTKTKRLDSGEPIFSQ